MSHLPMNPRAILSHLLSTTTSPDSRHHDRYGTLLDRYPQDLEQLLYSFLRPEVIKLFETRRVNHKTLQALQRTTDYPRTGIYYHSIFGRDRHYRAYIGQSNDIPTRIKKQHMYFRWRRDHPSLHYHALQDSTFDTYIVLAVISNPRAFNPCDLALLLNLLEMWCCLLFQTLPRSVLREYLLEDTPILSKDSADLNVASPLDQGDTNIYHDVEELANSSDSLIKSYYKRNRPRTPPIQQNIPSVTGKRDIILGGLVFILTATVLVQRHALGSSRSGTSPARGIRSIGLDILSKLWPRNS